MKHFCLHAFKCHPSCYVTKVRPTFNFHNCDITFKPKITKCLLYMLLNELCWIIWNIHTVYELYRRTTSPKLVKAYSDPLWSSLKSVQCLEKSLFFCLLLLYLDDDWGNWVKFRWTTDNEDTQLNIPQNTFTKHNRTHSVNSKVSKHVRILREDSFTFN